MEVAFFGGRGSGSVVGGRGVAGRGSLVGSQWSLIYKLQAWKKYIGQNVLFQK